MPPVALAAGTAPSGTPTAAQSQCAACAARGECLVGQLPPAQREQIRPWIQERSGHKHEVLLQQGDPIGVLSMVKVGAVLVTRKGADDRPRPIGILGSGSTLGAFGLLGQRSVLGAQAITPVRLCELQVSQLQQAEQRGLIAATHFTQAGLRAYELLADWAQVARVQGTTGQVAAALLILSKGQRSQMVRLPGHAVLGGLLGTTRESVARALSRLAQHGRLLRRDRWHCEIVEERLRACVAETPGVAL